MACSCEFDNEAMGCVKGTPHVISLAILVSKKGLWSLELLVSLKQIHGFFCCSLESNKEKFLYLSWYIILTAFIRTFPSELELVPVFLLDPHDVWHRWFVTMRVCPLFRMFYSSFVRISHIKFGVSDMETKLKVWGVLFCSLRDLFTLILWQSKAFVHGINDFTVWLHAI